MTVINSAISHQNTKRLVWVDWAKAILIFLVVLGHSGSIFSPILYLFHIPAFFFVSGYLCNYSRNETGTLKSSRWMVYSILLYNLGFILINAIWANINGRGIFHAHSGTGWYEILLRPLIGIFWCYYKTSEHTNPLLAQFWFVWVLIILKWLYRYIYPFSIKNKFILVIGCICFAIVTYHFNIRTFFYIDRTIIALPFFMLGNMSNEYQLFTSKIGGVKGCNSATKAIISLVLLIGCTILGKYSGNLGVDMFHFRMGNSVILYYILALAGTFSLILGCQALPRVKIIELISTGTFLILAIHLIIVQYLQDIIPDPTRIIIASGIVLACVPVIQLIKNICPLLLGKKKSRISKLISAPIK